MVLKIRQSLRKEFLLKINYKSSEYIYENSFEYYMLKIATPAGEGQ
jgi:hypothetical protein